MKVELFYNEKDAENLFTSLGFSVEKDTILQKNAVHGSCVIYHETQKKVVINPQTQERVLLQNAMQRLFQHKLLSDMYFYNKMDALSALSGHAVKDPARELCKELGD